MKTALKLIEQNRVADNMKYFIKELETRMGIEFVKSPRTTDDGRAWQAYETKETASKYPDHDNLSKEAQDIVRKLRDGKIVVKDWSFPSHQAVIVKVKDLQKLINKC